MIFHIFSQEVLYIFYCIFSIYPKEYFWEQIEQFPLLLLLFFFLIFFCRLCDFVTIYMFLKLFFFVEKIYRLGRMSEESIFSHCWRGDWIAKNRKPSRGIWKGFDFSDIIRDVGVDGFIFIWFSLLSPYHDLLSDWLLKSGS